MAGRHDAHNANVSHNGHDCRGAAHVLHDEEVKLGMGATLKCRLRLGGALADTPKLRFAALEGGAAFDTFAAMLAVCGQAPRAKTIDRDDIGMAELGHGLGLAGETLGEGRLAADLRRQNLQRHQAVKLLLAGLVHRPHAAAADKFQDVQFREQRRKLLHRRRRSAPGGLGLDLIGEADGVGLQPAFQQAGRAEIFGTVAGQRRAALRASVRVGHRFRIPFAAAWGQAPARAPRRSLII